MIVSMKKISILLYHRERERFLNALQDLGVVHIVENPKKEESGLAESAELLRRAATVIAGLKSVASSARRAGASTEAPGEARSGLSVIEKYEELETRRLAAESALKRDLKDEALLLPWGDFNPDMLSRLSTAGLKVSFFRVPLSEYVEIEQEDLTIQPIGQHGKDMLLAAISKGPAQIPGAEEVRLPQRSLVSLQREIRAIRDDLDVINKGVIQLSVSIEEVEAFRTARKHEFDYQAAMLDMAEHAEGRLLSLSGWLPAKREAAVAKYLDGFSAWYDIQMPSRSDNVPVQLKNGPFSKLFEPITRLYMLPSYWELDPTPFFAPAFAFFTGMCLGDFGYGLMLLALAWAAYVKLTKKMRPFAALVMVLAGMTMLCGVLLNTCFGMPIFGAAGIKGAILPFGAEYFSPLGSFEGPKGTEYPAIGFALLIGYLQMNMAMILQLVNRIQRNEARTAILPLSWMMMFFGIIVWEAHANWFDLRVYDLEVSRLHVGRLLLAIPEMVGKAVCLGGVVLMFLSNLINGTANVAVRPLLFLWNFYNFATGNIGYLISYIRLFALGLTTGLLAATFNNLSLSFIAVDGVLRWNSPMVIFTILLLAVGHALVFVLGLVGAFVHPLRLTFVEFYQTLQFSGGGIEYRPLNRNN